jgi:hypothetical protein
MVRERRAEENLYDCPRSLLSHNSYSDSGEAMQASAEDQSSQAGSVDRRYRPDADESSVMMRGRVSVEGQQSRHSGPPSVSMGVWGDQSRPRVRQFGSEATAAQRRSVVVEPPPASFGGSAEPEDQLYAQPRHRQPAAQWSAAPADEAKPAGPRVLLTRKVSSQDALLPAAHWLRPELKPKPIEIRYRNGNSKACRQTSFYVSNLYYNFLVICFICHRQIIILFVMHKIICSGV